VESRDDPGSFRFAHIRQQHEADEDASGSWGEDPFCTNMQVPAYYLLYGTQQKDGIWKL
jgi:hypothetical protein